MKKQFFRVKQLADQTFSRAGKTDVLSDDLQEADRKVEYIKNSCQSVSKKLSGCLFLGQLQGESATKEKLMKKSPGYQLGATMLECSILCDEESLLKIILNKCGQAEKNLSEENAEHDCRVEQHVILPIQNILDVDIPNIIKQKRNVTKVCLDMDSAKTRYIQAQKHNSNNSSGVAKIESIKDELKDSEQKVEQSRDVLACEMFHLAARESELCYTVLQYYKFHKRYHEYALGILDKLIPELENDICSSRIKPVYGVDLEEHLQVTGRKIAFPIELCVCALLELGVDEEGLFRLAGGASKVKRMKLSFDAGCMTLATALTYRDPHVIAGALKSYLRELPEPLLTHSLYDEWLNAAKAQTHPDNKLQALWTVVHKLPKSNFDNLSYLIKFFHVLSKNHEINKMSPHNLAIVIAPSLIWTKDENGFGLNVNVSLYPSIIDLLVTYADWFFDKEMEFYLTLEPIINGEMEEKTFEKGIDNKGFDLKVVDKMNKSSIEKSSGQNHPGGDVESSAPNISRSQSITCLSEESHAYESPKPITRRKNKSIAPGPPIFKDERKKDDVRAGKENAHSAKRGESQLFGEKPDKPPRPVTISNSTLPRPSKVSRDQKSVEKSNENSKKYSTDDQIFSDKVEEKLDKVASHFVKDKVIKTIATISTNTESINKDKESCITNYLNCKNEKPVAAPRSVISSSIDVCENSKTDSDSKASEYNKVNLISVKKEWLLGKDSADLENLPLRKPAVPERPSTLKSQNLKFSRAHLDTNLRNDYENIQLSNENLNNECADELITEKPQANFTEKQVSIIEIRNQDKNILTETLKTVEDIATGNISYPGSITVLKEKSASQKKAHYEDNDIDNVKNAIGYERREERKSVTPITPRPFSLPGAEKPERPPKPDYKLSSPSSHTRTFSDGQIIDINFNNNSHVTGGNHNTYLGSSNNSEEHLISSNLISDSNHLAISSSPPKSSSIIKHPQTSPPPPPVPAKPRINSQSESTDF